MHGQQRDGQNATGGSYVSGTRVGGRTVDIMHQGFQTILCKSGLGIQNRARVAVQWW